MDLRGQIRLSIAHRRVARSLDSRNRGVAPKLDLGSADRQPHLTEQGCCAAANPADVIPTSPGTRLDVVHLLPIIHLEDLN